VLLATSLSIAAIALVLPFTPVGAAFGFVLPPPAFYAILVATVVSYLVIVEGVKRYFYRHLPTRSRR
jgi:Mg2+-importing ATPase